MMKLRGSNPKLSTCILLCRGIPHLVADGQELPHHSPHLRVPDDSDVVGSFVDADALEHGHIYRCIHIDLPPLVCNHGSTIATRWLASMGWIQGETRANDKNTELTIVRLGPLVTWR